MDNSDLLSKKEIIKEIEKVQKKLAGKKSSKTIQIGLFFVILCLMLFFLVFFIMDLINILILYFKRRQNISSKEKMYFVDDDNDFDTSGIQYENELDSIEDQIVKRNANLERRLGEMLKWKKSNKIPDAKIHSKIDMTVLEQKFDDYTYDKGKNGDSFWKMILMPPQYYKFINNQAKPFYRFIANDN
jgi:hypothetical protein